MSRSSALAFASVPFTAAEDCMSAAVTARLCTAGAAAGISQGQLAGDCHNLAACVRVLGLWLFGKLCALGMRTGVPQLAYIGCAAAQLLAAVGTLALSAAAWGDGARGHGEARDRDEVDGLAHGRRPAAVERDREAAS
eukprot:1159768-Prymnesium_polylepis.1